MSTNPRSATMNKVGKSSEIKAQARKLADVHFGTQPCLPFVGQVEFDRVLAHIQRGKPTLDMFTGAVFQLALC